MISNRELPAGTVLTAKFKKTAVTCTVLVDSEGKRTYELADGKTFTSPSAAGSAVMNGVACNGWRFWSVQGEEAAPTATTTSEPKARAARAPKPTATRTVAQIKRTRKQDTCPDGQVSWFCSACMDGFCAGKGETPDRCPHGHPRTTTDELAPPAGDAGEAPTED